MMKKHVDKPGHRSLDHSVLLGFNIKQNEKSTDTDSKEVLAKVGLINNKIGEAPADKNIDSIS